MGNSLIRVITASGTMVWSSASMGRVGMRRQIGFHAHAVRSCYVVLEEIAHEGCFFGAQADAFKSGMEDAGVGLLPAEVAGVDAAGEQVYQAEMCEIEVVSGCGPWRCSTQCQALAPGLGDVRGWALTSGSYVDPFCSALVVPGSKALFRG